MSLVASIREESYDSSLMVYLDYYESTWHGMIIRGRREGACQVP